MENKYDEMMEVTARIVALWDRRARRRVALAQLDSMIAMQAPAASYYAALGAVRGDVRAAARRAFEGKSDFSRLAKAEIRIHWSIARLALAYWFPVLAPAALDSLARLWPGPVLVSTR